MGLVETTTTVTKRAELQQVGAPTGEGVDRRERGGGDDYGESTAVMQVRTLGSPFLYFSSVFAANLQGV